MKFNIIQNGGVTIGTIAYSICTTDEEVAELVLGGHKGEYDWLKSQIPGYRHPICVLEDIYIYEQRQGHGRLALRKFHQWAAEQGAAFAILRIGTQGDDYCSGLLWRRKFYGSEGWASLKRPKVPYLTLHWMFRVLNSPQCLTEQIPLTFEPGKDLPFSPEPIE